MAKNRTSATKASDRQAVARMLLEGQSVRVIADTLGRSTATIQADVNDLRRDWTESARESMKAHLALELAKLGHVERSMYRELDRINDPAERLNAYDRIGRLICRRADVLGLRNLADLAKAETEMREAWHEIKTRMHYALNRVFADNREAYGEFLNHFNDYDPDEAEATLAELEFLQCR